MIKAQTCQFELPEKKAGEPGLTVGDRFLLQCSGSFGLPFKDNVQTSLLVAENASATPKAPGAKAQAPAKEDDLKYALRVLDVKESSENAFALVVTSYKAGSYADFTIVISDGTTQVQSPPLTWTVATVIDPNSEKKEPFGSVGPLSMSYPMWLWLSITGVVLFFALVATFILYRIDRRRRLKAELEKFSTMLTPFNQFSKEARAIQRKLSHMPAQTAGGDVLNQLNELFRLYLIRELAVPAMQVSDRELLRILRREHPTIYRDFQNELRRVFTELAHAKSDIAKVTARDGEDIFALMRKLAEGIHERKRKMKGSA